MSSVMILGVMAAASMDSRLGAAWRGWRPIRFRRFWNGADSMTPVSSAENARPSVSSRSTIRSTASTS